MACQNNIPKVKGMCSVPPLKLSCYHINVTDGYHATSGHRVCGNAPTNVTPLVERRAGSIPCQRSQAAVQVHLHSVEDTSRHQMWNDRGLSVASYACFSTINKCLIVVEQGYGIVLWHPAKQKPSSAILQLLFILI